MKLSIVSPVHQSGQMIEELVKRIIHSISPLTEDFEIVLVDDGSTDNSWQVISKLCQTDQRIKGIKFSRNFGQHHALTAGLDYAQGNWVVIMDSDLQDLPEEIHKLYKKAQEGFDVVLARRGKRKDALFKRFCNRAFYKVFNYFTGMRYDNRVGGFRIISRRVVEGLKKMREHHRFINGLIHWMGFPTVSVDVEHGERLEGKSSYTLKKLLKFAIEIITSYSEKPLRISIIIGFLMALCAFGFGIYILVKVFFFGSPVSGWASLTVSLYFLSGIIMMILGIIGLYLGKTFTEVKKRPIYIVSQTIGIEKNDSSL